MTSLAERLAATLAEHRAYDVVDADDAGMFVAWECTCHATGVPRRVEPFTAVVGEARAHQASHLADTVADWLDRRAQHLADTDGANISDVAVFARVGAQVSALEDARDVVRAEVAHG